MFGMYSQQTDPPERQAMVYPPQGSGLLSIGALVVLNPHLVIRGSQ